VGLGRQPVKIKQRIKVSQLFRFRIYHIIRRQLP
jgi:hypothetical protein